MDSWQIYLISFSRFSLQNWMIADERFFELTSFEQRIYRALQAVLRELILHLQAVDNSFIYSSWITSFSVLLILIISRTYLTISSYLSVCYAIFAKFMTYCISLIIYYNLNMHCHCSKRTLYQQKLQRQEETIILLEEFIEKEKEAHLLEIRAINESLEDFAKEKDCQIIQFEESILKLGKKLDHYKEKNCNLNEKVKENSNTIKACMEKKLNLESQILRLRDQLDKQREKHLENTKYISEMKQVVSLQEIQNKELHKQNLRLKQEIIYLQKEITNYSEVKDKFCNIEDISEEQYQKEISLLKNSLEQEFSKNTNDIFNSMTKKDLRDLNQDTISEKDMNYRTINHQPTFQKVNIEGVELKKLANYIDYGSTYFQLQNNELSLYESQKIYKFIADSLKKSKQTQQMLLEQKQINQDLATDLRQKLAYFDDEIKEISHKQIANKQTQTVQSSKITQIINLNSFLKVKVYELTKIIAFFSKFAVYLFSSLLLQSSKTKYFHFTETCVYKHIKPKKLNKLKSICFSIMFTLILKKIANKSKRILPDQKFSKQNLCKYIKNSYLSNLIYTFSLKQNRKIPVKNHKIEELVNEKSAINPQQKIVEIINQQHLNQGFVSSNYSQIFNRFIFQAQKKYA